MPVSIPVEINELMALTYLTFRTKRQVSCLSGECIKKNGICDGIKDCNDNSDETFSLCANNR